MKILIVGNMGYVGPLVVQQLRNTYPNAHLIGFDSGFFAHCLTNAPLLPETILDEQKFGDVREISEATLQGVDVVINLAAISNDIMGKIDESFTYEVNHKASVRLARLSKAAHVKSYIFASSCSIYGFVEKGQAYEDSSLNPLTAYAKSKAYTEADLKELADSAFSVTCLRFATACGMSPRLRLDLVLNDFVASALTVKKIVVLSDGTPWRPLIHVKDMARAIDWAIQREQSINDPYLVINAGSNEWNYQIQELANAVADEIPEVSVEINREAPPDKRSYQVNFDLFKSLAPNHQPLMTLQNTVLELKNALYAMNFQDSNFRQSHLIRLNVLSNLIASQESPLKKLLRSAQSQTSKAMV